MPLTVPPVDVLAIGHRTIDRLATAVRELVAERDRAQRDLDTMRRAYADMLAKHAAALRKIRSMIN